MSSAIWWWTSGGCLWLAFEAGQEGGGGELAHWLLLMMGFQPHLVAAVAAADGPDAPSTTGVCSS